MMLSSTNWWPTHRTTLVTALAKASISLSLLFLTIMSWFFGSSFDMRYRVHNLKLLAVDFDGGAIGSSIEAAYSTAFASSQFPTLEFASTVEYPDVASVEAGVCKKGYWGAIYAHAGATSRFRDAVTGDSTAKYNSSDAITYVFSETRYPATSDSYVKSSLAKVGTASRSFFYKLWNSNSSDVSLATINLTDSAALSAYLDPIKAVEINLAPMGQGTHMYLNTVCMVLPLLTQFFFIMAVNGISQPMGVFTNMPPSRIWMLRLAVGKIHALLLSLVFSGVIWAFREDWDGTGLMFARTWMIIWFYMEINYFIFDSVIGSYIPLPGIPFFILCWVLMNVGSTIFPVELQPGFYKFNYFFPAHEIYLLLIQTWSNGCFKKDYIALPVLFSWWVVGHVTTFFSAKKHVANAKAMPSVSTPRDLEEATLSGGASQRTVGKTSQMTPDPDDFTPDQRGDIEMRANGSSDEAQK